MFCRNCAGSKHIARDCSLESKSSRTKKGSTEFNAILTGLARIKKVVDVVNSTDFQYLCSLAERTSLYDGLRVGDIGMAGKGKDYDVGIASGFRRCARHGMAQGMRTSSKLEDAGIHC